jgi:hypothetical protein
MEASFHPHAQWVLNRASLMDHGNDEVDLTLKTIGPFFHQSGNRDEWLVVGLYQSQSLRPFWVQDFLREVF